MSDLTPRTEAGKRLLDKTHHGFEATPNELRDMRDAILAIEAEARNPEPIPDTPSLREAAQRLADITPGSPGYIKAWQDLRAALDPEAEAERNFSTRSIKG